VTDTTDRDERTNGRTDGRTSPSLKWSLTLSEHDIDDIFTL